MRWRRNLHDENLTKFGEILAGWVEEWACHQKTFQLTLKVRYPAIIGFGLLLGVVPVINSNEIKHF